MRTDGWTDGQTFRRHFRNFEKAPKKLKICSYYIQSDSGGICSTLGNDSMCDSKQKSSYEHGSDFERLRSYNRLKLRIEGKDY